MSGISKRIDAARGVLAQEDSRDSAESELNRRQGDAQQSSWFGTYLGSMVYGGLDGIITTFAVVSGVAGAQLGAQVILILGIGNLLADGFSMGTGDYLSTKSEREYYDREARRLSREIERAPDQQRAALRALYLQHGYTEPEAEQMVTLQTRSSQRWVNAIMIEELGLTKETTSPIYNAFATFIAFVLAGSLPLLVYLIGLLTPITATTAFTISVVLSAVALFSLGVAKVFVTRLNALRSGVEMLLVGGLAALVAYVIGALLKNIGG